MITTTQSGVRRWLVRLAVVATALALAGCGTLLHPERKGQASGDIDPRIALANGVGLLFFIIPGVVAYAVDFSNGTIYLPSGHTQAQVDSVSFEEELDIATLELMLAEHLGKPVELDHELLLAERVESLDEALALVRMSGVDDAERLETL
ncbi:hypothetical protein SAMN05192555_11555 [Franzmannia pantelleriensis]|uniref:Uncharacterized protein n=1 Tax=Franzmannia pantelleriensis TaxID=48727 RepID=A0A1G9UHF3_9GAMM|nr:hypothetical protein [Halomonas pantelleriensis]SDM58975.1 hypothetical protein SAMN05192555_11555 [Halomonas pantelleriensis]